MSRLPAAFGLAPRSCCCGQVRSPKLHRPPPSPKNSFWCPPCSDRRLIPSHHPSRQHRCDTARLVLLCEVAKLASAAQAPPAPREQGQPRAGLQGNQPHPPTTAAGAAGNRQHTREQNSQAWEPLASAALVLTCGSSQACSRLRKHSKCFCPHPPWAPAPQHPPSLTAPAPHCPAAPQIPALHK